jgi:hypothetical protein
MEKSLNEKDKQKYYHDHKKNLHDHSFVPGQKVIVTETQFLGKNKKFANTWTGPYVIVETTPTCIKLRFPNNKVKVVSPWRVKLWLEDEEDELPQGQISQGEDEEEESAGNHQKRKYIKKKFPPHQMQTRSKERERAYELTENSINAIKLNFHPNIADDLIKIATKLHYKIKLTPEEHQLHFGLSPSDRAFIISGGKTQIHSYNPQEVIEVLTNSKKKFVQLQPTPDTPPQEPKEELASEEEEEEDFHTPPPSPANSFGPPTRSDSSSSDTTSSEDNPTKERLIVPQVTPTKAASAPEVPYQNQWPAYALPKGAPEGTKYYKVPAKTPKGFVAPLTNQPEPPFVRIIGIPPKLQKTQSEPSTSGTAPEKKSSFGKQIKQVLTRKQAKEKDIQVPSVWSTGK